MNVSRMSIDGELGLTAQRVENQLIRWLKTECALTDGIRIDFWMEIRTVTD